MTKRYVDRGDVLQGVQRTIRDARVPYNMVRAMENFSLPDGRAKRRPGFSEVFEDRIRGQNICKSTGSVLETVGFPAKNSRQGYYKTPLSYGLIRAHPSFRLRSLVDWTIEFFLTLGDKEALVVNPYSRRAKKTGGAITYDFEMRTPGVYVFDKTILSNCHVFDPGTLDTPSGDVDLPANLSVAGGEQHFDAFPLTSLAISYTTTDLQVDSCIVEVSGADEGRYWPNEVRLSHDITGWSPGDQLHVALRYDSGTGVLQLLVDAAVVDTWTNPDPVLYAFAGEHDYINGVEWTEGIPIDTVLLNECTVRGSYQSACKIQTQMHGHQVFFQDYSNDPDVNAAPWCCSPPRGTALRDLRIWNIKRDISLIMANSRKTIRGSQPAGLVGNWPLDSGTGIIYDLVGGLPCSLHHTYPPYVNRSELTHKLGLHLGDGQHIIFAPGEDAHLLRSDAASRLHMMLSSYGAPIGPGTAKDFERFQGRHEFTCQIEIITPHTFQPEINRANESAPHSTKLMYSSLSDTFLEERLSMEGANSWNNMTLYQLDSGNRAVQNVTMLAEGNGSYAIKQFPRAYDMTLFSIEADPVEVAGTNASDRYKLPLIRGLLTPSGRVAMELMEDGGYLFAAPRLIRVVSETVLNPNALYTLTFVKRITYSAQSLEIPTGIQLEIWIGADGVTPAGPIITHRKEYRATAPIDSHIISSGGSPHRIVIATTLPGFYFTGDSFQVVASGVGGSLGGLINGVTYLGLVASGGGEVELYDNTTGAPIDTFGLADAGTPGVYEREGTLRSAPVRHKFAYEVIVGTSQVNSGWDESITGPNAAVLTNSTGPWEVPQRFMSPYQDQPGYFTLGMFRLWGAALDNADIQSYQQSSISSKDYSPNLILNIELEEITGRSIPNKARYPLLMDMGYKSWGTPQAYKFNLLEDGLSSAAARAHLYEPMVRGGFGMEDCLGYRTLRPIAPDTYDTGSLVSCNGLAPFQTTLSHKFALMAAFGDNIVLNTDLDETIDQLYFQAGGLLNEYASGKRWSGVVIGDRTVLLSPGGAPKVFNGKSAISAGIRKFSGGKPIVRVTPLVSGPGLEPGWYALRVVYHSEEYAIQSMSDVAVFEVPGTSNQSVTVFELAPHYDPRITSYTIHRTFRQPTKELAKSSPIFPIAQIHGHGPNIHSPVLLLTDDDTRLVPFPLGQDFTQMPDCAYGAVMNGRLFLGGDLVIPDVIYPSEAGNPERFDTVEKRIVLEEASGDRITGMVSLFGTIFVFKANSIWRLEEINSGTYQIQRIADIGAVSDDSLLVFTDPDSGRTLIFAWGVHGPYIFDGTSFAYIGQPIEEPGIPGPAGAEYTWLVPSSVVALHDIRNREIICLHTPRNKELNENFERRTEAVVFNYRSKAWYRYTGMVGACALSQSFSGDALASSNPATPGGGVVEFMNTYGAYIGGTNGKLYKWAGASSDGAPAGDELGPFVVSAYSAPTISFVGGTIPTDAYDHLWITILRAKNGNHYSVPVVGNTASSFDVDSVYSSDLGGLPFDPEEGDQLYICLPPASIEFPWDQLDVPFVSKQLLELYLWGDGDFYLDMQRDWDIANVMEQWRRVLSEGGKRRRVRLHQGEVSEAVKTKLTTFDAGASLDGFAYSMDVREESLRPQ